MGKMGFDFDKWKNKSSFYSVLAFKRSLSEILEMGSYSIL